MTTAAVQLSIEGLRACVDERFGLLYMRVACLAARAKKTMILDRVGTLSKYTRKPFDKEAGGGGRHHG